MSKTLFACPDVEVLTNIAILIAYIDTYPRIPIKKFFAYAIFYWRFTLKSI